MTVFGRSVQNKLTIKILRSKEMYDICYTLKFKLSFYLSNRNVYSVRTFIKCNLKKNSTANLFFRRQRALIKKDEKSIMCKNVHKFDANSFYQDDVGY